MQIEMNTNSYVSIVQKSPSQRDPTRTYFRQNIFGLLFSTKEARQIQKTD